MAKSKVDLSLLKRLVAELEGHINVAEHILTDSNPDLDEFTVEASKANGLADAISAEVSDIGFNIRALIRDARTPKSNILDTMLSPFKDSSSS